MAKLEDNGMCFACGQRNPVGLKLDFQFISQQFVAKTVISENYQSYQGIVHGGIITTMLDEAMGGYLFKKGEPAVTGSLEVRYRKPTPVGEPLVIRGWEEMRRGKIVKMRSSITLADGSVAAEGSAKMVLMGE